MVLTVYAHGVSQPSRTVNIFCKVNKLDYTDTSIDLMTGEHKKEPYLKINPAGQVPAITDDDFCLAECGTILKYIAQKFKVADHWYPTGDLVAQARINEYIDWQHTGLRKAGSDIFIGTVFTPMLSGKPIDEEKLAKDYETLDKTLGVMEMMFLKNKQFLCADTISIADIMAVSELTQVLAIQRHDVLANHPKLAAWKDRVVKELNPCYDEVNKVLMGFVANIKK
ncbi:glutathione S-transferase theta-1-like [Asterias rubens]|uniref:glutathione S-transferase theta-1-like n=1 Tax=Asterias rubens TaxID=7604 RepID=UPI0014557281|nr:glutathione S-transferase theta-1-like [Asterias rubens]